MFEGVKIRLCLNKIIWIFILAFCVFSCKKQDISQPEKIFSIDFGGNVKKIETLRYCSKTDAVLFLQKGNLIGDVQTNCGFYLYRVTYLTQNFDNQEIWVSGLLAVPDNEQIKGVVSYQHGTISNRKNAPSNPSYGEGMLIASLFAGNGYILLAPDYIGLGKSMEIPTYLHMPSTVNAVVDFLEIGSDIISKLTNGTNKDLFLVGFSQGGSNTSAVHRAIETNNITGLNLKASACIAGAYNLKYIASKFAIEKKSILYLGYVANSYAHIYNEDLNTIIKPEYAEIIPTLYDGSKSESAILEALPDEPNDFLTQQLLDDIANENDNWFTVALGQNETYLWKPINPMRLFYGTKDKDVSPEEATFAYDYMKSIGGNVELVCTGEHYHKESWQHALPEIQKWFNKLK